MNKHETSVSSIGRRELLGTGLRALLAIPIVVAGAAEAAGMPHLSESDPQAVALGYVHDAGKVDKSKNPTYKPGESCSNCLQLTGKAGDPYRPCNLFPGKLVNANGWCRGWTKKS